MPSKGNGALLGTQYSALALFWIIRVRKTIEIEDRDNCSGKMLGVGGQPS